MQYTVHTAVPITVTKNTIAPRASSSIHTLHEEAHPRGK